MPEWTVILTSLPGYVLSFAALLYAIIGGRGKASAAELERVSKELVECRADCDRMQREVLRLVRVLVKGEVD